MTTSDANPQLRSARRNLSEFGDAVLQAHHQAMACRDCEDVLERGIISAGQLTDLDTALRAAHYSGQFVWDHSVDEMLEELHRTWAAQGSRAEELIQKVQQQGFEPENLLRYRETQEVVDEWLDQRVLQKASLIYQEQRDSEEPW